MGFNIIIQNSSILIVTLIKALELLGSIRSSISAVLYQNIANSFHYFRIDFRRINDNNRRLFSNHRVPLGAIILPPKLTTGNYRNIHDLQNCTTIRKYWQIWEITWLCRNWRKMRNLEKLPFHGLFGLEASQILGPEGPQYLPTAQAK